MDTREPVVPLHVKMVDVDQYLEPDTRMVLLAARRQRQLEIVEDVAAPYWIGAQAYAYALRDLGYEAAAADIERKVARFIELGLDEERG